MSRRVSMYMQEAAIAHNSWVDCIYCATKFSFVYNKKQYLKKMGFFINRNTKNDN